MLETFEPGQLLQLPEYGSWPATAHEVESDGLWALRAAHAAQRPLLLRGEPGCGKSQVARAAAFMMGRAFLSEVVHARQERRELQWSYDAVARLGEAQVLGAGKRTEVGDRLDPIKFVTPRVLWWAFDWAGALAQAETCVTSVAIPATPEGWQPEQGCVVLIDEIDKAETDLPNGLLETLGNGAFPVPHRSKPVGRGGGEAPLVVITTNEERELPAAFLRRCLVHNMTLEENEDKLKTWLMERGAVHHPKLNEAVREQAATLLVGDRTRAQELGLPVPGQAEYLDLLRATVRMGRGEQEQLDVLKQIARFALIKQKVT